MVNIDIYYHLFKKGSAVIQWVSSTDSTQDCPLSQKNVIDSNSVTT